MDLLEQQRKHIRNNTKTGLFLKEKLPCGLVATLPVFLLAALALWWCSSSVVSFSRHAGLASHTLSTLNCSVDVQVDAKRRHDSPNETFYDDPKLNYSIGSPIQNWDDKRMSWIKHNPSYAAANRVLVVTGSQPSPCHNPIGDFFLLRLFKNKVDYCRIHGYDIFYNNAFLHPKMDSYWAKTPIIRAAMLAHPEVEWIWWVDSDAVITDMDFKLPLDKYNNYNLIVDGWPGMIYEERSWYGLNAGILLFRNCQWSMDFMDEWASMGPGYPYYEKWGHILKSTFKDKQFPIADDQSAMVYMLLEQKKKWADKVYIENEYCFQCYWASIVSRFQNVTKKYIELDKGASILRRRHAEVVTESYGELREKYLKDAGYGKETGRRPFITHFTGCSPCSGNHNPIYAGDSCKDGMEKALNFADNQVLRSFGYVHHSLMSSSVMPWQSDVAGTGD
ncbi:Galactomannan galactosyltransferase 1 [Heracleum sosnowskyi]|uniref:Galactomannan galactosyltransferase 1 n=1 Tax=Heracleum sosnowskyi TaxID=360622 RepID=A0AAD8IJ60_9APIA|nr:Galactomannan galactosyltransferase 1 [Heracleum sosnowskyi]